MNRQICIALMLAAGMTIGIARADNPPATQAATNPSAAQLPARLQPYARLAQQCRDYQLALAGADWQPYYSYDFSNGPDEYLTPQVIAQQRGTNVFVVPPGTAVPPNHVFPMLEYKLIDTPAGKCRVGVLFAPAQSPYAYLPIGKDVKGWFAVEFVGRNISEHPCDLSISCQTKVVQNFGMLPGPAFQFGGYNDTRNLITPVSSKVPGQPGADVDLPHDVLIEKDRWYKVRMEVADGKISAIVDDHLIGRTAVGDGYDPKVEEVVRLYTWGSTCEFKTFKIEKYAPGAKPSETEAWTKVFGTTSHEDVRARIDELVKLLGDGNGLVRSGAQSLLCNMGDLAITSLAAVDDKAPPQIQQSAEELLQAMQIPSTQPASVTPAPVPAPGDIPQQQPNQGGVLDKGAVIRD